jgi:hypothetical protein
MCDTLNDGLDRLFVLYFKLEQRSENPHGATSLLMGQCNVTF